MHGTNVNTTKQLNLCVSCEACMAACPLKAISMDYAQGHFVPSIDAERCTECGLCKELCPGIDIDPFGLSDREITESMFAGDSLGCSIAYSKDSEVRHNSTSGGIITHFIVEALKNNSFDRAFVLQFDTFRGVPVRLDSFTDAEQIKKAAKSKYIPVSVLNVIRALQEQPHLRYIIVGTPCQLAAIKKFIKRTNVSESPLLFLGLFCEQTLNFNVIKYYEERFKVNDEKMERFDFKTKERFGWPGNTKVSFDSGRQLLVDKQLRKDLKKYFRLNRCLFCTDKLNRQADISFGDCYIPKTGHCDGVSNVIVRTAKGKEIFDRYAHLFSLESVDLSPIIKSQGLHYKRQNLAYVKLLLKESRLTEKVKSNGTIDKKAARELRRMQRLLSWGALSHTKKIDFHRTYTEIVNIMKKNTRALKNHAAYVKHYLFYCAVVVVAILIHLTGKKKRRAVQPSLKNFIIFGGGLNNKGAQAMLFTAVDQVKRRFPGAHAYVFNEYDFRKSDGQKNIYNFTILPMNAGIQKWLLGFRKGKSAQSMLSEYGSRVIDTIQNAFQQADCIIDISGYALSSQFEFGTSFHYMINVLLGKKYSIPYYIFPQSVGPFDYRLRDKLLLFPLFALCLKYPKKIFIRERAGMDAIGRFANNNIEKSYDIVLQADSYRFANIFKHEKNISTVHIESNAVGIVPNEQILRRMGPETFYAMYRHIIDQLLKQGKRVYILRHSYQDLSICERIKREYGDTEEVRLLADDFYSFELEQIIQQFQFLIASRYHSVIHSYKHGVPVFVIGWALKYRELLEEFQQQEYCLDCRETIKTNELSGKLERLAGNYLQEKETIMAKMNAIRGKSVFSVMP